MDWFHCNRCYIRKGVAFAVSSCGHISCDRCTNPNHCAVCGAICNYLPISDQMKPQEQMFFQDPVRLIQSRLEHIAQIALFQRKQKERVMAYFRYKCVEVEKRLKDVTEQAHRQISELRRENEELKKPLSQRRDTKDDTASGCYPSSYPSVTKFKAPQNPRTEAEFGGSLSRQEEIPQDDVARGRITLFPLDHLLIRRLSRGGTIYVDYFESVWAITPPGSATSVSSSNSLHDHGFRTPTLLTPPPRTQHLPHNIFQHQFFNRPFLQSPRP